MVFRKPDDFCFRCERVGIAGFQSALVPKDHREGSAQFQRSEIFQVRFALFHPPLIAGLVLGAEEVAN
jgi:hypothetical protein